MSNVPGAFVSMLKMRCPKCREAQLFSEPNPYKLNTIGEMPGRCPKCDQPFSLEPGFYFGAAYVSYALMVAWNIFIALMIILIYGDLFDHFSEMMIGCIVTSIIVSPFMFRYSRVIYLYMFVRYKRGTVVKN